MTTCTNVIIITPLAQLLASSSSKSSSSSSRIFSGNITYPLQTMVTQYSLINHYVTLSQSSDISSFTTSLIKYHITYLRDRLSYILNSNSVAFDEEWKAHLSNLISIIDSKKPAAGFGFPNNVPFGPPI